MSNRGLHVETTDNDYAFADFGFGTCTLRAHSDRLTINLESDNPTALERAQQALTRDIERFGRREGLSITWTPLTSDE